MFDEALPVKLPLVVEIALLMVRVFAPIERAPLVNVRVPFTVGLELSVTPPELLIVRPLSTVLEAGISPPAVTPLEPV